MNSPKPRIDKSPYRLIIFDADGTLRCCTVPGQPCPNTEHEWALMPNVKETLSRYDFGPGGTLIGIASNQGGVALGYLSLETAYHLLADLYVAVTDHWPPHGFIQVCPHAPDAGCVCRKPEPYLLLRIMNSAGFWGPNVLYVGDMESDRECAERAGVHFMWAADFFGWNRHES